MYKFVGETIYKFMGGEEVGLVGLWTSINLWEVTSINLWEVTSINLWEGGVDRTISDQRTVRRSEYRKRDACCSQRVVAELRPGTPDLSTISAPCQRRAPEGLDKHTYGYMTYMVLSQDAQDHGC